MSENSKDEAFKAIAELSSKTIDEYCNLFDISANKKLDTSAGTLSNVPVEVTDGVEDAEDEDLVSKRVEIEDLKKRIKELEVEIESTKKQGSSKNRNYAVLCKLLTGTELIESNEQYIGMHLNNMDVFSYNVNDPDVADKLWNKLEYP